MSIFFNWREIISQINACSCTFVLKFIDATTNKAYKIPKRNRKKLNFDSLTKIFIMKTFEYVKTSQMECYLKIRNEIILLKRNVQINRNAVVFKTSARMISIQQISFFAFLILCILKRMLVNLLELLNIYASNSMHYFRRWPCSSSTFSRD